MSKIKEQLSQIRNSTPKHIQWLLLVAAFVVVIILLALVWGGNDKKDEDLSAVNAAAAELILEPNTPINWSGTLVGDKKTAVVKVKSTAPIDIVSVSHSNDINGFVLKSACAELKRITSKQSCSLNLGYAPTVAMPEQQDTISIVWKNGNDKDAIQKTTQIAVVLGAQAPVQEVEPVAIPESEPVLIPEPEYEPEYKPIQHEIIRDIETIAPSVTFEEPKDEYIPAPEACSDFAFPGYDAYGQQIGWIKPESGAYYFHPFSDSECDNPTGIYNPDNGIITDIDNRKKKIGTDVEHIGYAAFNGGMLPQLSNAPAIQPVIRAQQSDTPEWETNGARRLSADGTFENMGSIMKKKAVQEEIYLGSGNSVLPSAPYDRQFILRQYKPIPATIVSEVRADPEALANSFLPVRATVDRNVYSDAGRNVIIPAGTLMLGYVTGEIPGPYTSVGRMQIKWYQFILPNGMEYNFNGNEPFSGDSQGRSGVLGRGSTDYLEQFFMPMLTAFVPAAVNLIAPISDAFVNQIDLDNNTVVQSGMVRSSELAKNEIITAWNQVAQKLMVDMLNNAVPPFTIPAGTRITVYSPEDLVASCGELDSGKKCSLGYSTGQGTRADFKDLLEETKRYVDQINYEDPSWIGQARSFSNDTYCDCNGDKCEVKQECVGKGCDGYSYQTLLFWCQSMNYQSKKALQYEIYQQDQKAQYNQKVENLGGKGSKQFNEEILGVKYNTDGTVQNPYQSGSSSSEPAATTNVLTCLDGSLPDANGCCAGEIYTDMGEQGFNCCPEAGGDCFPPLL